MVESTLKVMDRKEDIGDYKPLALLPVAAISVSVIFTLVVVTLTVVGLVSRRPVLESWLIPLAFIGIALSVAGRWQIQLSEGTRDGRRLTNIAWWLSLVGGCIYAAYYAGNVMAFQGQARSFVQESYLKNLQEGQFDKAYILTLAPKMRKGMDIGEMKGRFGDVVAPFRMEKLPRLMLRSGGLIEVDPAGTVDWRQGVEGLEVTNRWRVRTPEGEFEAIITSLRSEDKDLAAAEWEIKRAYTGLKPMLLTTYGSMLLNLELEADTFMATWLREQMNMFRRHEMFAATEALSPEQRKEQISVFLARSIAGPFAARLGTPPHGLAPVQTIVQLLNPEPSLLLFMPGYAEMSKKLVRWDESRQTQPKSTKDEILNVILQREHVAMAMSSSTMSEGRVQIVIPPETVYTWIPEVVAAWLNLEVSLPILRYRSQGKLVAVCEDPKLVQALRERRRVLPERAPDDAKLVQEMRDRRAAEFDSIWNSTQRKWRIGEVRIDLARDLSDTRPTNELGPNPGGGMMRSPPR